MEDSESSGQALLVRGHASAPSGLALDPAVRLQTVALTFGAFWSVGILKVLTSSLWYPLVEELAPVSDVPVERLAWLGTSFSGASIAWSAVVFGLARSRRLSPAQLVDLGLVFGVGGTFLMALAEAQISLAELPARGPTWTALWLLLFPLIVPGPPRRVALGVAAAVLVAPLPTWIMSWFGIPAPSPAVLGAYVAVNTVAGGLALLPVAVFAGLQHRVDHAERTLRRMGSYQLVERLGQGGMGEVWRARHALLRRPAALKVIRADTLDRADGHSRERFEREAQATAELKSPHTVRLFDYGVTPDGRLYYAMELLEGLDLHRLVERFGPVPPERAVHLLVQVCDALDEAHEAGLVHRDIKPSNLVLCAYGRVRDHLKVVDFGLVARREEAPGADLTATGIVHGTPGFLAPEVATGAAPRGSADLYALGCVAWWLLAGRPVFERDHPMKAILAHVHDPPPVELLRAEQAIPPALERVVLDLLAKDPGARPASAAEVAERLRAVPLPRPWTPERAAAWWDAHHPTGGVLPTAAAR